MQYLSCYNKFFIFIYVVFFLFVNDITAQSNNFIHFSVGNGLVQSQITVLYQDSKGYLWIGTKGGVSKFDGLTFENYTIKNGLYNNFIYNICEDKKGRIWIVHPRGISIYENGNLKKFPINTPQTLLPFLVANADSSAFLIQSSSKNNNSVFHLKNNEFKDTIIFDNKFKNKNIEEIIYLNKNEYYIKTLFSDFYYCNQRIRKILGNNFSKIYTSVKYPNKYFASSDRKIFEFIHDSIRVIYSDTKYFRLFGVTQRGTFNVLAENNCIKEIDYKGKIIKTHKLESDITHLIEDTEQNLWIGTENGLYKLSAFHNFTEKHGMPPYVWTIFEDSGNKIWFASFFSKIGYLHGDTVITKQIDKKKFYIGSLIDRNKDIWIATTAGPNLLKNNKLFPIKGFSKGAVLFFFEDTVNKVRFVSASDGLNVQYNNKETYMFDTFCTTQTGIPLSMQKGNDGNYWLFTSRLYIKVNPLFLTEPKEFYQATDYMKQKFNKVSQATCRKLFQKYFKFQSFTDLNIARPVCSVKDSLGNIWLGAENGIWLFNYKSFKNIEIENLNEMISSLAIYKNKYLIIGGLRGIGILDLDLFYKGELKVDYYDKSNGFNGLETAQNCIFIDSKNRIWVATNNNVVMFEMEDLQYNLLPPRLHLLHISYSDNNINWNNFEPYNSEISYLNKNIKLSFTAICLTAPEHVEFMYKLDGYDNTWIGPVKNREIIYTNLPAGEYKFLLKACNNNNVWTHEKVFATFKIIPAWYQRLDVKIGGGILFLIIICIIIYSFFKKRNKKTEAEKRVAELQLKIVQNQIYPHFLFNAFSAVGSVIYKEQKETAYDFFVKLSKIIRAALDDTKRHSKTIDEELDFVTNYLALQKFRFKERFNYTIEKTEPVESLIQIPPMLVQTFVENAVKHGLEPLEKGGLLTVHIFQKQKNIYIEISDNGIGRKNAAKLNTSGTGLGIKIIEELCKLNDEKAKTKTSIQLTDLFDENKNAAGTRVNICIEIK